MQKLIINADDLGISDGMSFGILKAIQEGVVSSTSAIINLPTSEKGVRLIKDHTSTFIGLHMNFVLGKPVSDSEKVKSLLDQDGNFLTSGHYKNGGTMAFDYDAVYTEGEAQMMRFKEITGHLPEHIEVHSAFDKTVGHAIWNLAEKYHVNATQFFGYTNNTLPGWQPVGYPDLMNMMGIVNRGTKVSDFTNDGFKLNELTEEVVELHFHPGFLDQYLLDHSTLTTPRCRDLATLTDPTLKLWLNDHYSLTDFSYLKQA